MVRTLPFSDNPFGNAVWSYGHRNPQGLAVDSRGRLQEHKFGNSVMDEKHATAITELLSSYDRGAV